MKRLKATDAAIQRQRDKFLGVRSAITRELVKMQEDDGFIHDGWTGGALASWITPGIIRAVRRSRTLSGGKGKGSERKK